MIKVIFLDRDGVINEAFPIGKYVLSEDDFEFIDGSVEAIIKLREAGYKIVIVTNQRSISRGFLTHEKLDGIHKKMLRELENAGGKIDKIYYCPHDKNSCDCRKPEIGMFKKAEEELGEVDKKNSFMIGDSSSDILAGFNFGVKTIFIRSTLYSQESLKRKADYEVGSLLEAAELIVAS